MKIMKVLACQRCLFFSPEPGVPFRCEDPDRPDMDRRCRCVMGQLDWTLEEKMEELARLSKMGMQVPSESEVRYIHKLCEEEKRRREEAERKVMSLAFG